ncbi:MAG: TraR/DksA family transcriptional regulator [Actinobacteria bacterium]|nr:MAG: TraR/DksA family transcriptional regulator [Actinomycetota bacterium]
MDSTKRDAFRTHLEPELERLNAVIAEMEIEDRESLSDVSGENNYRDHMADQGSATFEREMGMTLEENAREARSAVRHALERMSEDLYGVCERCSAEIPVERLEAHPTATLCVPCKEAEESPR